MIRDAIKAEIQFQKADHQHGMLPTRVSALSHHLDRLDWGDGIVESQIIFPKLMHNQLMTCLSTYRSRHHAGAFHSLQEHTLHVTRHYAVTQILYTT